MRAEVEARGLQEELSRERRGREEAEARLLREELRLSERKTKEEAEARVFREELRLSERKTTEEANRLGRCPPHTPARGVIAGVGWQQS